jgi:hypothetical protein
VWSTPNDCRLLASTASADCKALGAIGTLELTDLGMRVLLYWIYVVLPILLKACLTDGKLEAFLVDPTECRSGYIPDTGTNRSLGVLQSYMSQKSCLAAGGLQPGSTLVSKSTVEVLSKRLGKGGFSIELWMQPARRLAAMAPILAFGADKVSAYPCANNFVVND